MCYPPTRELCWCFGKVSELLQMELTQKNSNAWKHFWVWTKGGKNKWKQEIWPKQIYPRLMPPTDILVAYGQILPYLNISNRYCKFQWQEALGHREILLFHTKSMVKYDHNHLNEMLQGRRTGVFLPKCMFSHHVIDLISINPTSQLILKTFEGLR